MATSQELLLWGSSGSFYPNCLPDEDSQSRLISLQGQIATESPQAKFIGSLHMTVFHCKPVSMFEYVRQHVNPELDQVKFYTSLIGLYAEMKTEFEPSTASIEGAVLLGKENTTLGLKLSLEPKLESWRAAARIGVSDILRESGISVQQLRAMALIDAYKETIGPSIPHVTLARNVGRLMTKGIELPDSIVFDGISPGTVTLAYDTL